MRHVYPVECEAYSTGASLLALIALPALSGLNVVEGLQISTNSVIFIQILFKVEDPTKLQHRH
jgi:hypothetical protein